MRDLPGFYFDIEKNRYFPDAERRKQSPYPIVKSILPGSQAPKSLSDPESSKLRKHWQPTLNIANTAAVLLKRQKAATKIRRDHAHHTIHSQQLASTSYSTKVTVQTPSNSSYTSLNISEQGIFLGDGRGVCFASENNNISPVYTLFSSISSIQASGDTIIYTSFGPRPQILNFNASTRESVILMPNMLQDVRASHLHGHSLTLAMRKKALYIPDLENTVSASSLNTGSDVLTLDRDANNIWTGARNGSVHLFDLRTNHKRNALDDRFMADGRQTAITNLRRIHEHQLLIVTMNGTVELHDIRMMQRFSRSQPVNSLHGHINSYTSDLGLALDPLQNFLFLAGEDLRVRVWSLRTGRQLDPPQKNWNGLLARTFPEPVQGMQVTSTRLTDTLWLISGSHFERYDLCRRII